MSLDFDNIKVTVGDETAKLAVNKVPVIALINGTDSPALTGTPTAPTAAAGTNTDQIATTKFVQTGLAGKTNTSVLPNDDVNAWTRFRLKALGGTGGNSINWYYPLAKLAKRTSQIWSSLNFSGRIGGYGNNDAGYIQGLIMNHGDSSRFSGMVFTDSESTENLIFAFCDLVAYKNADETLTVYVKVAGYHAFNLSIELLRSGCQVLYDGTYLTETPSGTLTAQLSTSTTRMTLGNGALSLGGVDVLNPAEEMMTDNVESAMKATKNYSTGDFIIVNHNLYKVTANIANGGNITVGTNVEKTTIADQLKLLANS